MNDDLRKIVEKEADKHAFDKNKPMTSMERVLAYQGFIAGVEYILKVTNLHPDMTKKEVS